MQTSTGPAISTRIRPPGRNAGRIRLVAGPGRECAERGPEAGAGDVAPVVSASLSRRDLAVLRAVAAGRCEMSGDCGGSLTIDGLCCCDQFVGPRLASAGLIAATDPRSGPARLTASGRALLEAA